MREVVSALGDYRKVVEGFRYISLLTDGGINPRNNVEEGAICMDNDTDFYIQFDNGERIWINQEIKNYLIPPRAHFFDLINEAKALSLCASKTTEAGFNNLFIVLSRDKIYLDLYKRSPSDGAYIEVPAMGNYNLWFGHNRDDASSIVRIPWIPEEYRQFRIAAGTDAPLNVGGTWIQYFGEALDCYNSFALSPAALATPLMSAVDNYGNNRHGWYLTNMDMVNSHYVRYSISWHKC